MTDDAQYTQEHCDSDSITPIHTITMATVTFRDATRTYPKSTEPAVDHLNLEVGDGEFLVLVGPSGCGKTTSLRMLAGLEHVDEGAILIDDRNVVKLAPRDRDIAMVFQNYALYPHMNVARTWASRCGSRRCRSRRSPSGCVRRPSSSTSRTTSTASRASSPAGSDSASRWAARSFASRVCS